MVKKSIYSATPRLYGWGLSVAASR